MVYKVVITPVAEHHLEMYVSYTLFTFKYKEYARAIIKDAKATKRRLAKIATTIPLCPNEELAKLGYRKISFSKHDFFMVYRIDGDTAVVEAMYHDLQDYENLFMEQIENQ